ncbi:hypothetical protein GCM10009839_60730 [Catenulispora yoronensis]|uniref:Leucine-rich repeat domain-containing protein n=1 Tax=Catenulispora yoronensis TaxID=450799 RepID=A0ABN2V135_9ACTN
MAVGQAEDDPERQNRLLDGLMRRAEESQSIQSAQSLHESRQLWLLAAACIAEPGMVDPERVERIRQETHEFLPPRTTYEAEAAAKAGHFVLDLLAELAVREHLDGEQAAATIHTASLVAVDDPISVGLFRRFRKRTEEQITPALISAWHKAADPSAFADQVLADADLSHGPVGINDPELIRWLFKLRNLTNLTINLPSGHRLDLESLSGMEKIRTLSVGGPLNLELAPLTTLPNLGVLRISSATSLDFARLSQLTHLTWLGLSQMKSVSLGPLAELRELATLSLNNIDTLDLSPLRHQSSITSLVLESLDSLDVTPIAAMRGLSTLRLTNVTNTWLPSLGEAGQIVDLRLSHVDTGPNILPDLTFVSRMANLSSLSLRGMPGIDLSPLAKAPQNLQLLLFNMPNVSVQALSRRKDITIRRHY